MAAMRAENGCDYLRIFTLSRFGFAQRQVGNSSYSLNIPCRKQSTGPC